MENKDKPRICEVLGVEVGEYFKVDFQSVTGVLYVDSDGTLMREDNVRCCEALSYMINHPECIHKIRYWTPEEVELAKAIKVVWPNASSIMQGHALHASQTITIFSPKFMLSEAVGSLRFPSLKPDEEVLLKDIIGGDDNG